MSVPSTADATEADQRAAGIETAKQWFARHAENPGAPMPPQVAEAVHRLLISTVSEEGGLGADHPPREVDR